MATQRYVALLRGINVGGRNTVAMSDLREAFADGGFTSVSTYIQSGNVLFSSTAAQTSLEAGIEPMLEKRLGVPLVVVVRSRRQVQAIIDAAPPGFGASPDSFHSDVVFLKRPLTPEQAMNALELRDGVDEAWAGTGVIYFARLSERRTQSRLSRIAAKPEYKLMTIRNWSTTNKLAALLASPPT